MVRGAERVFHPPRTLQFASLLTSVILFQRIAEWSVFTVSGEFTAGEGEKAGKGIRAGVKGVRSCFFFRCD